MSAAKTISITLAPELFRQAEDFAHREERTIDDVFSVALRSYLSSDPEWSEVLRYTRAVGREMGIQNEEDVELLSDEFRRQRRA